MRVRHEHPAPVPLSAVTAGFASVLVGITSSVASVFRPRTWPAPHPQILGSWLLALYVGISVSPIARSLRIAYPWSSRGRHPAPGATLLATSLQGTSMPAAVGAFLISAALITLCGVTGPFERILDKGR